MAGFDRDYLETVLYSLAEDIPEVREHLERRVGVLSRMDKEY